MILRLFHYLIFRIVQSATAIYATFRRIAYSTTFRTVSQLYNTLRGKDIQTELFTK
jgi:hypothetical protein